jgi:ketosteroid isomerase-like protein
MSSDAASVNLHWTEAFDRHDPDAYARLFSDDCVFTNVGTGRRLVGRAAARPSSRASAPIEH